MSDEKTKEGLSKEELAEIKGRLAPVFKNLSDARYKLSKQTNADISRVVHSCRMDVEEEKELLDLAYLLATEAAWAYFRYEASNYEDDARTEMNDLYQEFFLLVRSELINYDPEYDIVTFLLPRVKKTFYDTKTKGTGGSMPKHYQDAGLKIRRAVEDLEKLGNYNPTPEDIHEYISGTDGRGIAVKTIMRYRERTVSFLPIDYDKLALLGGKIKGTEEEFIERENQRLFHKIKESLSPKYKLVINLELMYEETYGELPDIPAMCSLIKEHTGQKCTEKYVSNLVTAANQQFGRYYRRYQKKSEAPVNHMMIDTAVMQEENMNILNAMKDNVDFFSTL